MRRPAHGGPLPVALTTLLLVALGTLAGPRPAGAQDRTPESEGRDDEENLFNTNNFHDDLFAWSGGGELRVPVSAQVAIALGARYQRNGQASYVPAGGISRSPDGSVAIESMTTDANQMALTLGVAFHPFVEGAEHDGHRR